MSFYKEQLNNWLKTLDIKADRVLDLGGAANPVIKRVKSFETEEYICFDLGVEEPKTEYIKFDINLPLEQLEGYNEESFKFDCLFCLEVFEYVWNTMGAMRNISRLLCNDGMAYISFPSQYPLHQPKEIDYLRYTKYGILKLAQEAGLGIKEMVPRVATMGKNSLSDFYRLEGMHPVKGDDSIFDIGYICKCYKPFL